MANIIDYIKWRGDLELKNSKFNEIDSKIVSCCWKWKYNLKEQNMRKLNLIVVFNTDFEKVLFCIRAKEPYKGLYNFVGGKIEEGETNDEAAYRELF